MSEATKDAGAPAETEQQQAAQPERPMPTTVVQAIARVMEELPGIGKTDHSEQGYNYRGIESITRHAQQLFGKYGVVPVPRVVERKTVELTINNKPWTEEQLSVVYRLHGPSHGTWEERRVVLAEGPAAGTVVTIDQQIEDWIEVGPLLGLGRDNSDKGANKSMTQAFKYALIQALVIGDGNDDPDKGAANVADAKAEPVDPAKAARAEVALRIRQLAPAAREQVREFCNAEERGYGVVAARWTDEQLAEVESFLDRKALAEEAADEAGEQPAAPAEASAPTEAAAQQAAPDAAADGPTDAEVDAVIERVKAMPPEEVDVELRKRNMRASGTEESRRRRLAEAQVAELSTPTLTSEA